MAFPLNCLSYSLAKKKKLRLWQNFEASAKSVVSFVGTVNRIVSADSLLVERDDEIVIKVFLSSLRQPRYFLMFFWNLTYSLGRKKKL